eukprot:TRINITY_DN15782_c0_g1_i1.p1 TRINITY_DN15782_c0_g1~~TRINITY_DN15782_c0_g1_i1.p1  ORF type:complete len:772 (-),score=144.88 TRINITY_DN15782_c0_g1_i1:19-2061(-)
MAQTRRSPAHSIAPVGSLYSSPMAQNLGGFADQQFIDQRLEKGFAPATGKVERPKLNHKQEPIQVDANQKQPVMTPLQLLQRLQGQHEKLEVKGEKPTNTGGQRGLLALQLLQEKLQRQAKEGAAPQEASNVVPNGVPKAPREGRKGEKVYAALERLKERLSQPQNSLLYGAQHGLLEKGGSRGKAAERNDRGRSQTLRPMSPEFSNFAKLAFMISNCCRRMDHKGCEDALVKFRAEGFKFNETIFQDVLRMYKHLKFAPQYLDTLREVISENMVIPVSWFNEAIAFSSSIEEGLQFYTYALDNSIANSDTLELMSSLYIKQKDYDGVMGIINDAKSKSLKFSPSAILKLLGFVLEGESAVVDQFWADFETIIEVNTKTFNQMYHTLVHTRGVDLMPHVEKRMRILRVRPDSKTYAPLFEWYLKTRNEKKLLAIIHMMDTKNIQIMYQNCVDALELFATLDRGSSPSEEAIEAIFILFSHLDKIGFAAPLWSYNTLLQIFTRWSLAQEVEKVLDHMKKNDVMPDVETYNILILMYAQQCDLKQVDATYERLLNSGITPNERTFHVIARLCQNLGNTQALMTAGQKMVHENGIPVTITILNQYVKVMAQEGNFESVMTILQKMSGKGIQPNIETFGCIVKYLHEEGNKKALKDMGWMMQQRGIAPTRWMTKLFSEFDIFVE